MDHKARTIHMVMAFYPVNGIGALLRNYHDVSDNGELTVVTIGEPVSFEREDISALMDGIRVLSVKERLFSYPFGKLIRRLCCRHIRFRKMLYPKVLLKIIREEKADCIHIHYSSCLKVLDEIRTDLGGVRLFFTCHSRPDKIFPEETGETDEIAGRLIRENGMRLIALYPDMKEELDERFCVDSTVVINNGIDLNRFRHPVRDRETVRRELSIPEDALVLGHVGYFLPAKNHKFLIRLFLEAASKSDTAFFLFVGDGSLRELVEERLTSWGLEGRFLCLGNRSDIPELLQAMDVYVMPSTHEGFSMALLEAQAAGLPCLISDGMSDDIMLTDRIVSLSLDAPVSEWCDYVLHPEKIVNDSPKGNLEDYDISVCVRKLEQLYSGEI